MPEAVARYHLQPAGRPAAAKQLNLAIGLPLRDEPALDELLREIYDPASPRFRQYLTPDQFAERFGPAEADYQALVDFMKANGLAVTATHPNRVVLDVQGSVADIERVFHVTMRTYAHPEEARTFYAPEGEPAIDLAVPLLHVSGLNNYSLPHPAGLHLIDPADQPADAKPNAGSGPGGSYRGNDFRAAYVPGVSLTGSNQNVALVQFDGYYSNDIASYISQTGLTNYPISLTNIAVNGGVSTPGSGNGEVCLDIEMVISIAPGTSKIIVYEAPNGSTSWPTMLSTIANNNLAKSIGCSWGGGPPDPTSELLFKQMASQGQSFFNASGDSAAFTGAIPFPSESTNITQVGGTTLSTTGPGGSYVSETVWNQGTGTGSSGGISPTYPIPAWQLGIDMTANHGSTTMRNIPDVALTGDHVWVAYNNGGSGTFAGTSCAAPLWAGFTALVNQQAVASGRPVVGFVNPAVYAIGKSASYTADFHDVTTGNNTWSSSPTLFYATNGYDLCTGWGTPNGLNLINALAVPDTLGVSPGSGFTATGSVGGPFDVTSQNYSLTNSGGASLPWSVVGIPTWLNVAPAAGTLPTSGSTTVSVSLNATANTLGAGVYAATLSFSNQTTHVTQNRSFALTVLAPNVVQNGGFEAGLGFTNWTVSNNDGFNYVDNGSLTHGFISPHSGTNFAAFGQYSANGLCTLSQTVPTVPGQIYVLSYWWESVNLGFGTTPNELKVVLNGVTLLDQFNAGVVGWTNQHFNFTAAGSTATLLFAFADDNAYLALDDVSVVLAPAPLISSAAVTGGAIHFNWSATIGLNYQVQYKTNLTQLSWIDLGGVTNAAASIISFADTNPVAKYPQRYYRVKMTP